MKWLFWLAVIVFALVVAGVLTFHHSPGNVEVDVHTKTLEQQTEHAVQEGQALLKKAEQSSQANSPTSPPPQTSSR